MMLVAVVAIVVAIVVATISWAVTEWYLAKETKNS